MVGAEKEEEEEAIVEAVECAAAAALDALMAGGEPGAPPAVRLAPAVGFAARGLPAAVAHEGTTAALFYGSPPPASWPAPAEEVEGGGGAPPATPAQRAAALVGQLSDLLPEDAVAAAVASLRALSDALAEEEEEGEGQLGFALVAYEAETHTIIAARDAAGAAPLHWGVTPAGLLLIGADPADLAECFPSAAPFPAGAVFASRGSREGEGSEEPGEAGFVMVGAGGGAVAPGRLASFVPRSARPASGAGRPPLARGGGGGGFKAIRTVPRVNEAGVLCGSVFRVASEGESLVDLTRGPRAGKA